MINELGICFGMNLFPSYLCALFLKPKVITLKQE